MEQLGLGGWGLGAGNAAAVPKKIGELPHLVVEKHMPDTWGMEIHHGPTHPDFWGFLAILLTSGEGLQRQSPNMVYKAVQDADIEVV